MGAGGREVALAMFRQKQILVKSSMLFFFFFFLVRTSVFVSTEKYFVTQLRKFSEYCMHVDADLVCVVN